MKTLTQLSKEELEAFEKEFPQKLIRKSLNFGIESDPRNDLKSWLLAHDRRIIKAAFAATEVEKNEITSDTEAIIKRDRLMERSLAEAMIENVGFNAALSEVNNLKQEFLK